MQPLYAAMLLTILPVSPSFASGLVSLSDAEMAETQGQALFNLSYIAPTDAANLEQARAGSNIGFYKLGLEAEVELNINARKLQLGCGGRNGPDGCDIDIDNLSLSGDATTREGRASSSAKLTNPFIEFAIKNPNSASTREISGFRLSAEQVQGLLTTGLENSTTPNGINSISGFLRIQSDASGYVYGKANTGARFLEAKNGANYVVDGVPQTYNNEITGKIDAQLLGATLATLSIKTVAGGLQIPAMERIPFLRNAVVVNSNRISSLPLQATLNIPRIIADFRGVNPPAGTVEYHNPVETPIDWTFDVPKEVRVQGGPLDAQITSCSGLSCGLLPVLGINIGDILQNDFIKATIEGITGDVTINQGLGYIHSLPIQSAAYLSLQNQALRWPGSYSGLASVSSSQVVTDVAQPGWWLSLADPVNLGSVDPVKDIDIAPLFPQIATQVSAQLNQTPYPSIATDGLIAAIFGTGDINVTVNAPINLAANPLVLTLNDLQLSGQGFVPNCYGTLTFC